MSGKKDATPEDFGGEDNMPSTEELDALQAEIDRVLDSAAENTGPEPSKPGERKPGEGETDAPAADNRVAELEMEMANLKDQALRAMADAENVKKRAEREVAAAKIYGIERFATDILSVYDNLGRALQTLDGKTQGDLGENAKNLVDGIELTEKNMMAVLARHGVKAVPGKGSKFDPNVHQAVAQIPSDEDKGHVAEVMQTGFTIGDRTLRAAMVAVSTGKSA